MPGGAGRSIVLGVRRLVEHQAVAVALDLEPDRDEDVVDCVFERMTGQVATLRVTRSKSRAMKRLAGGALGFLTFDQHGGTVALRGAARAMLGGAAVEFVVVDGVGVLQTGSSPVPETGVSRAESSLERFVGYLKAGDSDGAIDLATRLLDNGLAPASWSWMCSFRRRRASGCAGRLGSGQSRWSTSRPVSRTLCWLSRAFAPRPRRRSEAVWSWSAPRPSATPCRREWSPSC